MTEDEYDMVRDAVSAFNAMTPDERHAAYEDFFEDRDLTPDEETIFWELYDEAGA